MTYTLPVFMDGMVIIGGVPVDYHRLVMVVIGILLVAGCGCSPISPNWAWPSRAWPG